MKNQTILSINNLDVYYKTSFHGADSIRDLFIECVKNPATLLFKKQKKLEVLKNINLEVKRGERVALMGINGAGKTSLCRAIAGLHGSNSKISVNGEVRAIFDTSVAVQPELSGKENAWILTNLLFSKHSKQERQDIVAEALEFTELKQFVNIPFKKYSKGMKARLFLSLISARPSELLILDEVFSGADTFFNEKISKRIEKLIKDSNAVIFISHINELLVKLCSRAVILHRSKVVYDGDILKAILIYKKLNRENKNTTFE